jgi:hypothetical protein
MTHHEFTKSKRQPGPISIDSLQGLLSPDIIEAAKEVSKIFTQAKIRHVLVGGIAVGMHGYPRLTKDVDFLVGEEAFDHLGRIVSPRSGLPINFNQIPIDWVSLSEQERPVFERFLVDHTNAPEVQAIPLPPLVLMKLIAGRSRDKTDVVELLKAGADANEIRLFLLSSRPDLVPAFETLQAAAAQELG